ncbi:MAG TPA: hypothetical protein VGQ08_18565 [Nitrospiraceae bacterium]|jgi:hypothetical protein|nr:hypothetical protein [Nitrospiraceae bacterium]
MGCGSSEQTTNQTSDVTQQTTFKPASPEERALLQQFSGLGEAQRQALLSRLQAVTGGASPFQLSAADQALVDQMFGSAQQQLELQNKDYADFLSGGRGLRMSDTPIAQQAMQRQALGLADLLSQKANTSFNLGLQGNQYLNSAALGLSGALPAGSAAAFNPLFQERLASGKTRAVGQASGTTISTPSLMDQIGTGLKLAGSFGATGAGFLAPGVGSLALGGGAATSGYGRGLGLTSGSVGGMFG